MKAGRPLVSVITTTYQLARYLPQCIESVLDQDYPSAQLQLILVDDASTDETSAVVSRYDDPRLRFVRLRENRGPAGARNVGLSLAQGELIAFLDADDYWFPNRLSSMTSLVSNDTDLITSDFLFEDCGNVISESAYRGRKLEWLFDLEAGAQFRALLEDGYLALSMMMIPRTVLQRVGTFDESLRVCQDYDLWLRCLRAGSRVVCASEPLGVYRRMRSGSITSTEGERHVKERFVVLRPYLHMCSPGRSSTIRGDIADLALRRGIRSRDLISILKAGLALAFNPRYLWRRLVRRFTRHRRPIMTTPLVALRETLMSHV